MIDNKNILGQEKISKLLIRMSTPAVVGMLVHSLYNIVDTIFIAKGVGTDAIGGLAIAFPIQMFILAIGMLFGTGAASVISRFLGAKNYKGANRTAANTLLYSGLFGLAITVPLLLYLKPLLVLLGASEGLLPYASDYLYIIILGTPLTIFSMSGNNIVRSEGNAKVAMVSMLLGTGLNILLDPLFIFTFKMGIEGAAMATVIAQVISFIYMLNYFLKSKGSLIIKKEDMSLDINKLGNVLLLGLPSFIRQAGTSFVGMIMNVMLATYGGDLTVSTFGVINKLFMFGLMPVFGIAQGFQPIAGFNYGAKKMKRVWSVLKQSIVVSTIICTIYTLIMYFAPGFMLSLLTNDREVIELGSVIIRVIIVLIPFVGIQVIGSTFFLSIGKIIPSFVLGLSRQIILLLPLILILPKYLGIDGIWISFPIADAVALLITTLWLIVEVSILKRESRAGDKEVSLKIS